MSKEKILVVEDDKNITKLVKYNLEKDGYECVMAGSGEDALDVLRKKLVNLVILDIMLPSMDGFEVARVMKQSEKLRGIPIIMLTAK